MLNLSDIGRGPTKSTEISCQGEFGTGRGQRRQGRPVCPASLQHTGKFFMYFATLWAKFLIWKGAESKRTIRLCSRCSIEGCSCMSPMRRATSVGGSSGTFTLSDRGRDLCRPLSNQVSHPSPAVTISSLLLCWPCWQLPTLVLGHNLHHYIFFPIFFIIYLVTSCKGGATADV